MARLTGSPVKAITKVRLHMREELEVAVDNAAEATRKKFELAVRSWHNRPRFIKRLFTADTTVRKQVIAQGTKKVLAIFGWVDEGTEAHMIFPKDPGGKLAFTTGYSARTSPVANPNSGTGQATGDKVFSKGVLHPGTEAREFTGYYAEEARIMLHREVVQAVRRVARRR